MPFSLVGMMLSSPLPDCWILLVWSRCSCASLLSLLNRDRLNTSHPLLTLEPADQLKSSPQTRR